MFHLLQIYFEADTLNFRAGLSIHSHRASTMVGVPRSTGCATCRKRSVKVSKNRSPFATTLNLLQCDETRPTCAQCRRGGRTCSGYVRSMKFIDEGIKMRVGRTGSPAMPRLDLNSTRPSSASSQRLQIVSNFVHDLFPSGPGHLQQSHIGGWLWLVPTIVQQHSTLGLAAEALALMYFAKKSTAAGRSDEALVRSSEAYLQAIRDLSRALQNPHKCLSLETLCSSLLLVHYEVSARSEWFSVSNVAFLKRDSPH
jgi:hypothetical protein